MGRWRIVLAVAGIALGLFGVGRLVTQIPAGPAWSGWGLAGRRAGHPRRHRVAADSGRRLRCSAGCRPAAGATCRPG